MILPIESAQISTLRAIEQKLLWLSTWMIHNANHIRPNEDGLKIGGHQASSASLVTIMTALRFITPSNICWAIERDMIWNIFADLVGRNPIHLVPRMVKMLIFQLGRWA